MKDRERKTQPMNGPPRGNLLRAYGENLGWAAARMKTACLDAIQGKVTANSSSCSSIAGRPQ